MTSDDKQPSSQESPSSAGSPDDIQSALSQMSERVNASFDAYGHLFKALSHVSHSQALQPFSAMSGNEQQDAVNALAKVMEYWYSDPKRAIEIQSSLWGDYLSLWQNILTKMSGKDVESFVKPDQTDRRFTDPDWEQNVGFDMIKQLYLTTSRWAEQMVKNADIDEKTRKKAEFYLRAMSAAIAPTNNPFTNPEVLRETMSSNGENLLRGIKMLAEDIEKGGGVLKVRQTDETAFKVGESLANTTGRVIFKNDLIEIIQYNPTTPQISKVPLLIVPPWINKFYILDLSPQKSFIKWCVDRGLSVFCISWVNPTEKHAGYGFEEYIEHGFFAALKTVKKATGSRDIHAIGYCIGGTMLATALAYLKHKPLEDIQVAAASFLTAQVDFSESGDLQVFVDESQIHALEKTMKKHGFLKSQSMAQTFNLMRPNDLIWSYYVDTYLKGTPPKAFDILFWNSDSTRMALKCHLFYLRHFYLENNLSNGKLKIRDININLKDVEIPIYSLATIEDHIAPARSVYKGTKCFGSNVTFTLAGSGHIAGVINHPDRNKYQYWVNFDPTHTFDDFLTSALEVPGSWWVHWLAWFKGQHSELVPADYHKILYNVSDIPAPGHYVTEK